LPQVDTWNDDPVEGGLTKCPGQHKKKKKSGGIDENERKKALPHASDARKRREVGK